MSTLFLSLAIVVLVEYALSLRLDEVPKGMIATPHGIRPKQCVHQTKDNNHILTHMDNGVHVSYPSLGIEEFYPELPECIENMKQLRLSHSTAHKYNNISLRPAEGWKIYGSYNTPDAMGNFSSQYILPNEEPKNEGQILYYFIGFEDMGQNNITIIQPVVAYCPQGCGYSYTRGWTMASWNCCPAGETWYGTGVQLEAGVTVEAYTYSTGSEAVVYESFNGKASILNIKNDYRVFNWACVTGEFYNYRDCNAFNSKAFTFANMQITDLKGDNQKPEWKTTNNIQNCGASLTYTNVSAVMIGTAN